MEQNNNEIKNADVKEYVSNIYLLVVGCVILLAVFFAVINAVDLLEEFKVPDSINPLLLLALITVNILFWLVASYTWNKVVFYYSKQNITIVVCFIHTSLILVGKYLPGKLWGFVLRGKDLTTRNVSKSQVLMSNYVEQVISIHAGIVLGIIGWLISSKPQFWQPLLLITLLTPLLASSINNYILTHFDKLISKISKSSGLITSKFNFKQYLILYTLYFIEWVLMGSMLLIIWLLLSQKGVTYQDALFLLSANACAFIVGFFAFFSPGGIGVREGVLVGLLANYIGFSESVYLSIIFRIWLILTDATAGLIAIKLLFAGKKAET